VTFVGFSNNLPAGVSLVSATPSQGSVAVSGSAVYGNLQALSVGATATVTIVVTPGPGAAGTLTSIASVTNSSTVIDLNQDNNTTTVTSTVVLPVSDVGLSIMPSTNTVMVGSNLSYTITITNNGPQNALNVVVSDLLPAALGVISNSASQGTISSVGNTVTCNVGTLVSGASATITVSAVALAAGVVSNAASVATASTDPNPTNNAASAIVTVVNPTPNIVAAGARILSKSVGVADGSIDPGDTVTVSLALSNVGSANTTNLSATLLAGNGVVLSSGAQSNNYGALLYGGAAKSNAFTFTASGTNGGAVTATLQLQDGVNTNLAPVSFAFYFPATFTFSNTAAITIPDHGIANPYPAPISTVSFTNASGGTGVVTKATATLYGFAHTFPHDVSALLADPAGGDVLLMAHTGGGVSVSNVMLTFDDDAASSLPNLTMLTSGTYKPTSYQPTNLPAPVPAGAYGSTLASLDGSNPNGAWSLFVFDDSPGDAGLVAGGWSITLTAKYPVNPLADLAIGLTSHPTNLFVGGTLLTNVISVTNLGPSQATGVTVTDVLPPGFSIWSTTLSQGLATVVSGTLTWSIPNLAVGSAATATILIAPTQEGAFVNVVSVDGNETDLNPGNNSAQADTTVLSPAPATLSGFVTNGQLHLTVSAQPNFKYLIEASTSLGAGAAWVPIATNVASPSGAISLVDTNVFTYRFYRAVRVIP